MLSYPSSNIASLGITITRKRGVSGRPILSGVRRDKGFCGVTGEESDKLLCTLPFDASNVIAAGGLASLPSHQCGGVGSDTTKSEEKPPSSSEVGEGGGGLGGREGDSSEVGVAGEGGGGGGGGGGETDGEIFCTPPCDTSTVIG